VGRVAYQTQSFLDAGKSTMGGNILYLTGMVDKRTLEKYEKEAKDAGRESWYLSWALDTNAEERAKVKQQEKKKKKSIIHVTTLFMTI
jgi:translation elongation factor EF-1alpha